jgi:hypothetical protein
MSQPSLKEGEDYYIDENGLYVFTEAYHIRRGYCCRSGCRRCPYGYLGEGEDEEKRVKRIVDESGS